jgi:hypothetical protein
MYHEPGIMYVSKNFDLPVQYMCNSTTKCKNKLSHGNEIYVRENVNVAPSGVNVNILPFIRYKVAQTCQPTICKHKKYTTTTKDKSKVQNL